MGRRTKGVSSDFRFLASTADHADKFQGKIYWRAHDRTKHEPKIMSENTQTSNVIFFLGAGASVAAGIPAVGPMTEEFVGHIAENHKDCKPTLDEVMGRLKQQTPNPDIEIILRTLHRLIDHKNDDLSKFLKVDHKLEVSELEKLRDELQTFIRNKVIRPQGVDYLSPLLNSNWGAPAHIFSVNYDTCIELLCRNLQRRIIDGFIPEWTPRALEETNDSSAVYLYKLHGSALWYSSDGGWPIKIPIGANNNSTSEIELYDGKKAKPIILYPMSKQPMEAPLLDFTYILKRRLESAKFLIVIGYSFRDDYLAALFRDSFNVNRDLHMINIGPDSRCHYKELMKRGPSFKQVFQRRVTCLPFSAERILKDFTLNQFPVLSQSIKNWRDCDRATMTGGDIAWHVQIGPLSH